MRYLLYTLFSLCIFGAFESIIFLWKDKYPRLMEVNSRVDIINLLICLSISVWIAVILWWLI